MYVCMYVCMHDYQEVLAFIDERLGELELEKKELTEYDSLDKQRRWLGTPTPSYIHTFIYAYILTYIHVGLWNSRSMTRNSRKAVSSYSRLR